MAELNKVMLIGRLTKDPELRYIPSGMAVAQLRMAVNHTYYKRGEGGAGGEKKEEVLYIDVSVWGKGGETVKKYLAKGRELFVEGRLQQEEWTDKQGQKRISYRVNADNFQFIGGGGQRTERGDDGGQGGAYDGGDPGDGGGGGGGGGGTRGGASDGPPAQQQEDDLPF